MILPEPALQGPSRGREEAEDMDLVDDMSWFSFGYLFRCYFDLVYPV